MTRRRQYRKKSSVNIGTIIAVVALIVLAGLIAKAACNRMSRSAHESIHGATLDSLTMVIVPDGHNGRTLDYVDFIVDFNPEHHQPNFASWILTRDMVENSTAPRRDNFRPDPDVPESSTLADYKRSGYDRGHIVPAGDMKHDPDAMDRTFFLTNISPQLNQLNAGPWKTLEDNCRNWAVRDSVLVIVAGPILTDRLNKKIGTTGVTVPQRYFKVILAPNADPPRGIGFVMNNGANPGGVQATALTIRQVEELTGYDFFSSLPDDLENKIETEARYSVWQYTR